MIYIIMSLLSAAETPRRTESGTAKDEPTQHESTDNINQPNSNNQVITEIEVYRPGRSPSPVTTILLWQRFRCIVILGRYMWLKPIFTSVFIFYYSLQLA